MKNILGIDFGQKYIGLAFSRAGLVTPLEILNYKKNHVMGTEAINKIAQLIIDEKITLVVMGMPYNFETPNAKEIIEFCELIKVKLHELNMNGVEFVLFDEYRSSKDSVNEMIKIGVSQKNRSQNHSFAAAKIISDYLQQFPS